MSLTHWYLLSSLVGLIRFRYEGWDRLHAQCVDVCLFAVIKAEKMVVVFLLCFYGLLSQNASTSLRVISAWLSWQQCKYFIQWICPAVCVCMCSLMLQWDRIGACLIVYIIPWQEFNGLLQKKKKKVLSNVATSVQGSVREGSSALDRPTLTHTV